MRTAAAIFIFAVGCHASLGQGIDNTTSTTCSDVPPDNKYTCAQQKGWGKCSESFMQGHCCKTCFNCNGHGCGSGPAPGPAPGPHPGPAPGPGSSLYMTTCHNDKECGSTCSGKYSSDMVALTEGQYGTSCTCQSPGLKTVCSYSGQEIQVCADGKPPNCRTACGQKICINKGGKTATGTILSACPKHHPQNTGACCQHKSDAYCTCMIRPTIDVNAAPYAKVGGSNGQVKVTSGACGSQLASLDIDINSARASELIKPFLSDGVFTEKNATMEEYKTTHETECYGLAEGECGAKLGCTYCKSQSKSHPVRTDCYTQNEAAVLEHIITTEDAPGMFTCGSA